MHRGLVVLTDDELHDQLKRAAKHFASAGNGELIVLRVVDEDQYQSAIQRKAESGEHTPTFDELKKSATDQAEEVAADAFGNEIEYSVIGLVGEISEDILRIAENHDCDHIFITGKERSPTGKVLFGDIAQSIILKFDGPVTVTTDSS